MLPRMSLCTGYYDNIDVYFGHMLVSDDLSPFTNWLEKYTLIVAMDSVVLHGEAEGYVKSLEKLPLKDVGSPRLVL